MFLDFANQYSFHSIEKIFSTYHTMKSLIIKANPSKTSFSHSLAEAYKDGGTQAGKEVEILDLYDVDQPFLRYESTEALKQ